MVSMCLLYNSCIFSLVNYLFMTYFLSISFSNNKVELLIFHFCCHYFSQLVICIFILAMILFMELKNIK